MAFYANTQQVLSSTNRAIYNEMFFAGAKPKFPGIYKCQYCNYEDVINRKCQKLPRCAACGNTGAIWKLLVRMVDQ